MFTKMKKILINVEVSKRTKIDNNMLKLADRFVREDFLMLYYSRSDVHGSVPGPLVLDSIAGDRIG